MQRGSLAGLIFVSVSAVALVNSIGYSFGKLSAPGPGFFPGIVSAFLLVAGAVLLLGSGTEAASASPRVPWRRLCYVTASVAIFPAILQLAGFIIAVFVSALLASYANPHTRLSTTVLASAIVAGVLTLIFVNALRLPLAALPNW